MDLDLDYSDNYFVFAFSVWFPEIQIIGYTGLYPRSDLESRSSRPDFFSFFFECAHSLICRVTPYLDQQRIVSFVHHHVVDCTDELLE